jgi:multiple antibiotic resistance protein
MTVSLSQLVLFAISLLAMFSPLATLGPAAGLLGSAPIESQRRVAITVARNYLIVLLVTVALGKFLLSALGISTAALTFTGGAALLHQGWPLMTRAGKAVDRDVQSIASAGSIESMVWVTITFPITIGGGTIAVVIGAAGRYSSLPDLAAIGAVCVAMAIPVYLTFLFAGRLVGRLGNGATDAVNRISGIILFALGSQLTVEGLRGLYMLSRPA